MNSRLLMGLAPAALLLAIAANAQPPGPPPGAGARTVMMHRGAPGPEMKAMHEAMAKQHLEDLKTVLRLRPDQEAALQAFVASHHAGDRRVMIHRGPGGADAKGPDVAPPKPMSTPERLDEMAKHEEAMTAEHKKSRDALAKFYAALGPDQQKVFDALQRLHGPGGHMGARGGHGGGNMGGGPNVRRIEIRRGPGGGAPTPGHDPD